ncbi:hypothetical protein ACFGOO_06390 [Treponema vincentii]|uniref:hypothetical protein n=1 Tax=Treponema vincentii TaxID=69710 RepID=UPI0035F5771D
MYVVKKIAALLCITVCTALLNLYAQSEQHEVQETVIFIDVSKSMEKGFKDLQRHIVDTVIAEVPQDTRVTIFQFYRTMELMYKGEMTSQTERYKAANTVYALRPNKAWTNFRPIFDYVSTHTSPGTQFFIYSDGLEEVEHNKSSFVLTEEVLTPLFPGLVFVKDERNPNAYRLYPPSLDLPSASSPAETAVAGTTAVPQKHSILLYVVICLMLLILIAAVAVFMLRRRNDPHKNPIRVPIPGYIQDAEDGIAISFFNTCMYPYGKLFIWSPDFKRQPFLLDYILQKYERNAVLIQIELRLIAKKYVPIRTFITKAVDVELKQSFIRKLLADEDLMQIPGAESLFREAAILADADTVLLPRHEYAGRVPEFKEPYLELFVYWACCDGFLTAPQLALIEKIAIDFSISSYIISGFFKEALKVSSAERIEHVKLLLAQLVAESSATTEKKAAISVNLRTYLSLIDSAQCSGKKNRASAAFKKRCLRQLKYI